MGTLAPRRSPIRQFAPSSPALPPASSSHNVDGNHDPVAKVLQFSLKTTTTTTAAAVVVPDHNGNSLPSILTPGIDLHNQLQHQQQQQQRAVSPLLYGTDRSPSARLDGDFSDGDDDFNVNVPRQRFLEGAGDAPEINPAPVRIVPPSITTADTAKAERRKLKSSE